LLAAGDFSLTFFSRYGSIQLNYSKVSSMSKCEVFGLARLNSRVYSLRGGSLPGGSKTRNKTVRKYLQHLMYKNFISFTLSAFQE
jgi:hypothetical protein